MIRATSPTMGHSASAPEFRPYRWRGQRGLAAQMEPPPPSGRKREPTKSQDAYRERLERLAAMRVHDIPGDNFPPPGVLTLEQAARELGVSTRTLLRYKQQLRQKAGTS